MNCSPRDVRFICSRVEAFYLVSVRFGENYETKMSEFVRNVVSKIWVEISKATAKVETHLRVIQLNADYTMAPSNTCFICETRQQLVQDPTL